MSEAATDPRRARAGRVRGLYAVTPDLADSAALVTRVEAALRGGAALIQYRNKSAPSALRLEQARALARVRASRGGMLIVNDDPLLAAEIGADGVHVGADDASVTAAREIVGPDRLVGASCYNELARASRAIALGADYVAFGSFFPSGVKPLARRAGLGLLGEARALGAPVVAIGGIDAANARDVFEAGADAVAVISAVFDADDVAAAAEAIVAAASGARRALS